MPNFYDSILIGDTLGVYDEINLSYWLVTLFVFELSANLPVYKLLKKVDL